VVSEETSFGEEEISVELSLAPEIRFPETETVGQAETRFE